MSEMIGQIDINLPWHRQLAVGFADNDDSTYESNGIILESMNVVDHVSNWRRSTECYQDAGDEPARG